MFYYYDINIGLGIMEKSILKHDTRRHTHNISMYLRLLCRLWRQLHKKKKKIVAMRVPVSFPSARHFYNPIKKMFNVALTERFSHPIPFYTVSSFLCGKTSHFTEQLIIKPLMIWIRCVMSKKPINCTG